MLWAGGLVLVAALVMAGTSAVKRQVHSFSLRAALLPSGFMTGGCNDYMRSVQKESSHEY